MKQEQIFRGGARPDQPPALVYLSSSESDSDEDDSPESVSRKRKAEEMLPLGFLDPLPRHQSPPLDLPLTSTSSQCLEICALPTPENSLKQFWKAGDFEGNPGFGDWDSTSGGMDHVRVHPKFLHSNATSHKWVLGAFAELLDNSLDEMMVEGWIPTSCGSACPLGTLLRVNWQTPLDNMETALRQAP